MQQFFQKRDLNSHHTRTWY